MRYSHSIAKRDTAPAAPGLLTRIIIMLNLSLPEGANQSIYTVRLTFDTLRIRADLRRSEGQIEVQLETDDGADVEWSVTPMQVAECQHDKRQLARMVIGYLGSDYWLDPSIDVTEDEETGETLYAGRTKYDHIDSMIISIE